MDASASRTAGIANGAFCVSISWAKIPNEKTSAAEVVFRPPFTASGAM